MTTTVASPEYLLELIHQTGYWRVVIRPAVFKPNRIATLNDCWRIVEESRVTQRGWDYPYVDRADRTCRDDWVQCGIAFDNFIEFWRFYQSGQFVHQFAVTEDREDRWSMSGERSPSDVVKGPSTLSFLNLLYTMTEILEFARRLAHREALGDVAGIRVELHGMQGRRLTLPHLPRISAEYVSHSETITWEDVGPTADLIATAPGMALNATTHVLERFQWIDAPVRMLDAEQRRFYEKRWWVASS